MTTHFYLPFQTHNFLQDTNRGLHILHVLHHHASLAVLLAEVAMARIHAHIAYDLAKGGTLIVWAIGIAYKE